MATVTDSRAPATKSEAFVDQQLGRARQRIRALDVTAAVLGLAILTLVYGLGVILLDGRLELPSRVRQLGFVGYVLISLAYVGVTIVWPLCRRINPYFAARQLEETLDAAKNSVVNWLDLHAEPLPPAIRVAVSQRAAKDLARADLDTAINGRRAAWLAGVAGLLLFAMFVQFVVGGRQFISLFGRAFAPFVEASIKTRTQLTLLQPETGDTTVAVGQAVSFRVQVTGRIPAPEKPDALKLLYRYHAGEPYEEQRLEPDSTREWVTTFPAFQVHNGFWYKITGGDAETAEYRVRVRSTPLLTDFEVNYHFRPYLGWPDQQTRDPNLKAMRGTEVTLLARANRNIKSAELHLEDGKKSIPYEPVPGEPQAMRFRFVLDQDDSYRIWFLSEEGERNSDPMPYEIKVLRDVPPRVVLTKPGEDTALPVNGVLQLKGSASDDFAVTGLKLRLQVNDQQPLLDKPYRDGKQLRLGDGAWPLTLDYADLIELDKVRQGGTPLKPGMVLEYWLEATDNCDYPPPGPNVGRSEKFKLTLAEPQQEQKKEEEKKQAEQERHNHEQKQDRDLQQQKKPQNGGKQEQQNQEQQEQSPSSPEDQALKDQEKRLERAIKEQEKEQQQNKEPSKGENQKQGGEKSQPQGKPEPSKQSQPKQGEQGGQEDQKPEKGEQGKQPDKKPQQGGSQQKNDSAGEGSEKQTPDPKSQGNQGREPKKSEGNSNKTQQEKPVPQPQDKDQAKEPDKPNSRDGQQEKSGADKGAGARSKPEAGLQEKTGDDQPRPGGDGKNQPSKPEEKTSGSGNAQTTKPDRKPQQNRDDPGSAAKPESEPKKDKDSSKKGSDNQSGQNNKKPESKSVEQSGSQAEKRSQENAGDNQPKDSAKGEPKIASNKGKDKPSGKNDTKPAGQEQNQRNGESSSPKPSDPAVKDLIDKLKSADPETRKEIADRLSKMQQHTKNKQDAEAIEKALKEAREQGDKKPSPGQGDKQSERGNEPQAKSGEAPKPADQGSEKGRANKSDDKAGGNRDKSGDSQTPSPSEKEQQRPDPKGRPDPNRKEKGEPDATVPGPQQQPPKVAKPGDAPGNPTTGERQADSPPGDPNPAPQEGSAADPRFQKKAGELQLEDFKKKVTKEVLQKANMTEAEYQKFLKAYEEMLRKQKDAPPKTNEKLADPKRKGGTLPNQGARRVKGEQDKNAMQGSGPGTAPPEYLEAYRAFTEKLSNIDRGRDKK